MSDFSDYAMMEQLDPVVLGSWIRLLQGNSKSTTPSRGGLLSGVTSGDLSAHEGPFTFTAETATAGSTAIFNASRKGFASWFAVKGYERSVQPLADLSKKRQLYQFEGTTVNDDDKLMPFPPHLMLIPKGEENNTEFSFLAGLAELQGMIPSLTPKSLGAAALQWMVKPLLRMTNYNGELRGVADKVTKVRELELYNRDHRKSDRDIMGGKNLGLQDDWYSDRRFADQAFTGVDPTTIERVSDHLFHEFVEAAGREGYEDWAKILPQINRDQLYMNDCSYIRQAVEAKPDEELKDVKQDGVKVWACASVTLYRLEDNGQLHPVAIVLDYKDSMRDSVTIFNQAKDSRAVRVPLEKDDWPWRYAKMCSQVSSYIRHEVGTHLTRAHFVEEAIIIATHRTIPPEHMVYRLLEPHWERTLSLNANARAMLVPDVIHQVLGLDLGQIRKLIRHEYTNMDYTQSYLPKDLARRGFPDTIKGLDDDDRYKDYAYAKQALRMWHIIHRYVRAMLLEQYQDGSDELVAKDEAISDWAAEVQNAALIKSFPEIKTFDALVDAVTMSIHIAAPFHSAVNYLQHFYLSFVPSRPPALSAAPPISLAELSTYTEDNILQALPMGQQRQWLLAVQVPWLLSFKVGSDLSLKTFAETQRLLFTGECAPDQTVCNASESLSSELDKLAKEIKELNKAMNAGYLEYTVLDPLNQAKSIQI